MQMPETQSLIGMTRDVAPFGSQYTQDSAMGQQSYLGDASTFAGFGEYPRRDLRDSGASPTVEPFASPGKRRRQQRREGSTDDDMHVAQKPRQKRREGDDSPPFVPSDSDSDWFVRTMGDPEPRQSLYPEPPRRYTPPTAQPGRTSTTQPQPSWENETSLLLSDLLAEEALGSSTILGIDDDSWVSEGYIPTNETMLAEPSEIPAASEPLSTSSRRTRGKKTTIALPQTIDPALLQQDPVNRQRIEPPSRPFGQDTDPGALRRSERGKNPQAPAPTPARPRATHQATGDFAAMTQGVFDEEGDAQQSTRASKPLRKWVCSLGCWLLTTSKSDVNKHIEGIHKDRLDAEAVLDDGTIPKLTGTDILQRGARIHGCPEGCQLQEYGRSKIQTHINTVHKDHKGPKLEPKLLEIIPTSLAFPRSEVKSTNYMKPDQGEPVHRCPGCNKSFQGQDAFEKHTERCDGESRFQCPLCEKSYVQKQDLNRHLASKHVGETLDENKQGEMGHHCPMCNQIYVRESQLKSHMETCEGGRYKCPEPGCDKEFSKKPNVKLHVEVVHRKTRTTPKRVKVKCKECGKEFSKRRDMDNHILQKHKEAEYVFICPMKTCPYRNPIEWNTARHIQRTHTGLKSGPQRRKLSELED